MSFHRLTHNYRDDINEQEGVAHVLFRPRTLTLEMCKNDFIFDWVKGYFYFPESAERS